MSPEAGQSAQSRGSSFYLCHPDIQCLQFPAFAPWGVIGTCKTSIGLVGRHVYTSAGLLVAEPDSGLRVLNAVSRYPPGNRYNHVSSALPCSLPLPHSFPCMTHITRLPKAVMDALIIRSSR